MERILKERKQRIPIQYILGKASFMGLELEVEPGVLVPRPDTETLVAVVLSKLTAEHSRLAHTNSHLIIAEIGVGAGPIAISILKALSFCRVFACDIATKAIEIAGKNAIRYLVHGRLELVVGDWHHVLPSGFDTIVSNPPYLSESQTISLPEEVTLEPREALFAQSDDGMSFYRDFADVLPSHFKDETGWLAIECGDGQSEAIRKIFSERGWRDITVHLDIHALPRVLTAQVPI